MSRPWKPPALVQAPDQYRASVDAWLLAAFAARFGARFFCDLGTGSGPVAHGLHHATGAPGVAIERNPVLCALARTNLAPFPVTVVRGDLRGFAWRAGAVDLVVCNPPYYAVGSGRVNHNAAVAEARHAFHGDLAAFAACAARLCAPRGVFCFIYPADLLPPMMRRLTRAGWWPVGSLGIRSFAGGRVRLRCVALARGARGYVFSSDLVLYEAQRSYTEAAFAFLETVCAKGNERTGKIET